MIKTVKSIKINTNVSRPGTKARILLDFIKEDYKKGANSVNLLSMARKLYGNVSTDAKVNARQVAGRVRKLLLKQGIAWYASPITRIYTVHPVNSSEANLMQRMKWAAAFGIVKNNNTSSRIYEEVLGLTMEDMADPALIPLNKDILLRLVERTVSPDEDDEEAIS